MPGINILSFDWAFWFQWVMATTMGWIIGGFLFTGLALVTSGVAVGILQWLVLLGRIRRPWRWILASAVGWIVGYLIVILGLPPELDFLNGMVLGLSVGTAQWLILREQLHWAGWWIVFSAIGWTTGLTLLPGFLLTGIMAGGLTGIALEVLSRSPKLNLKGQQK
jgi:hypothetical protein